MPGGGVTFWACANTPPPAFGWSPSPCSHGEEISADSGTRWGALAVPGG